MDNNYIDNSFNNMMSTTAKAQLAYAREWWVGAWARYLFERLVGKRGPFMSGRWVGAVPL